MKMIKVFLTIVLIMVLNACTSKEDNSTSNNSDFSGDYSVEVSKISIGDVSVLPGSVPALSTNSSLKEATTVITLKNSGSAPFLISNLKVSASPGFSIKLNRCSSSIAARSSCQVTVAFSNRNLYDGNFNSALEINEAVLPILASVTGQPDPNISGIPELTLTLDSPFVPTTAIPYRTLTVKNIGTGTAKNLSAALPNEYEVRINRCPSNLKPKESCEIQVLYKNYRSPVVPPAAPISVATSNVPAVPSINPSSGQIVVPFNKNQVTGIAFSSDGKSLSITGTGLDSVVSVEIYKADGQTLMDRLVIETKLPSSLIAKPSKNIVLNENEIIIRIL